MHKMTTDKLNLDDQFLCQTVQNLCFFKRIANTFLSDCGAPKCGDGENSLSLSTGLH